MTLQDLPLRMQVKIALSADGCWEWQGYRNPKGYGQVGIGSRTDGSRRRVLTHRHVYALLRGPIPDGLQLDHLCRNPRCCNPDHLEPVTSSENLHRGDTSANNGNKIKTHCKHGHEYTPENTKRDASGHRFCATCHRDRARRRMRAVRAAQRGSA